MMYVWGWLEPRLKPILIVVIAVVVIVAVVWITVKRQESRALKAQIEYFEITKVDDEVARILKLEDFAKKFSGEDVSFQALMTLGEYNYKNGKLEESAGFYGRVVDNSGSSLIHYLAVDALSPVYVDMGKAKKAAELYLESSDLSSDPNPYRSKLKAAGLLLLAGESKRAGEIYEGLVADEGTPAKFKLKAEEQLLWIAVSK
jgi:predicted negative regulator of RcsB-dependent stress response